MWIAQIILETLFSRLKRYFKLTIPFRTCERKQKQFINRKNVFIFKPRVQKPRPPSAKQNNDYKNLKIKPEPSVNTYQESHQQQKPYYPQIKVEPGAYNPTLQPFQHQIQQQFSLPSAQSLFSNQNIFNNKTNYNNSTDPNINSNPVFKNLQQNLPATNTSNSHLLANNFQMTSMSLMNHFLNNQKQQQQQPHKYFFFVFENKFRTLYKQTYIKTN